MRAAGPLLFGAVFWACGEGEGEPLVPAPAPVPVERAIPDGAPVMERPERVVVGEPCLIDVALVPPARSAKSPLASKPSADLVKARAILEGIVQSEGRAADNPWAVGHAMLALGPDVKLDNGRTAVDFLFEEYAEVQDVGGQPGVAFPSRRGQILIEPHTDLLLKALTEAGLDPGRSVTVAGQAHPIDHLWRRSLCAAWVDGERTAFGTWNDVPWALQGLAQWAPDDLSWKADGGHAMTMDAFTSATVAQLAKETAFLHEARAKGLQVQKRKQGIFDYTCGGAHLLQGAIWAVGRGFGTEADRVAIAREVSIHLWRIDIELGAVDPLIKSRPEFASLLLIQRVKYLGHALETVHKAAALGLFTPTAEERALLQRVADELAATVLDIEERGFVRDLAKIRAEREQTWLDYIGDSAHAVRGIDLHTGAGEVRF